MDKAALSQNQSLLPSNYPRPSPAPSFPLSHSANLPLLLRLSGSPAVNIPSLLNNTEPPPPPLHAQFPLNPHLHLATSTQ